jgi:hypothetical protein
VQFCTFLIKLNIWSLEVSSQEPIISSRKWWATFVGLLTLESILMYKILTSEASTNLLIFSAFVAILLFLLLIIDRIAKVTANGEGVSIEVYEQKLSNLEKTLKEQVNQVGDDVKEDVKNKVGQLGEDINDLLFLTILDAYEYITLKKARGDELDDSYEFNYPKGQDLIERLRNRGLIEERENRLKFNGENQGNINIREFFSITDRGNKYLDALNQKGLGKELETIAKRTGYGK